MALHTFASAALHSGLVQALSVSKPVVQYAIVRIGLNKVLNPLKKVMFSTHHCCLWKLYFLPVECWHGDPWLIRLVFR